MNLVLAAPLLQRRDEKRLPNVAGIISTGLYLIFPPLAGTTLQRAPRR